MDSLAIAEPTTFARGFVRACVELVPGDWDDVNYEFSYPDLVAHRTDLSTLFCGTSGVLEAQVSVFCEDDQPEAYCLITTDAGRQFDFTGRLVGETVEVTAIGPVPDFAPSGLGTAAWLPRPT